MGNLGFHALSHAMSMLSDALALCKKPSIYLIFIHKLRFCLTVMGIYAYKGRIVI